MFAVYVRFAKRDPVNRLSKRLRGNVRRPSERAIEGTVTKVLRSTMSTTAKRIMREARELREPTDQIAAAPLADNLFEWHFTIAGPAGTAFEGGRYHGGWCLPSLHTMLPSPLSVLPQHSLTLRLVLGYGFGCM